MLRSLALAVLYILLGAPASLVCVPVTLITRDASMLYVWGMEVARIGLRCFNMKPRSRGLENVDRDRQYIFLANHVSNLDPVMLLPEIPVKIAVFVKSSLMHIPILGYCMRLSNFIPVKRAGDVEGARASIRRAGEVLASGMSIVSFVEGTRSATGRLLPFKKGPFYLAAETKMPILPVSIYGTEKMMPKGSMAIRRGEVNIVFHAAIWPEEYADRESLMRAVRESIASGLPEWMRG